MRWFLIAAIFFLDGCRWIKSPPVAPKAPPASESAQLLQEVYRVVFVRDPKNAVEFGIYVDTLQQGASLEGIYNGFTHSQYYRELERKNPGSSPQALRQFGELLAALELEFEMPREFDVEETQPLAIPVMPSAEFIDEGPPAKRMFSKKPDERVLADYYSKFFVGASIYTLKRVLADEALKVISAKAENKESLPIWYSKWVVHMSKFNVDFGLPSRNRADESFHFDWATQVPEDRLRWEVLNRLHRVLNSANQS